MKIIKSRLFKILIVLFIFGFFMGFIYYYLSDCSSINDSIINYINLIDNDGYNYFNSFINSLFYNYSFEFIIWFSGICFIFSFVIPFLIIFKGISMGFIFTGIIYVFHIKGLLYALIILFPFIINSFIYIFTSYYSINYSIKCYKLYKNDKLISYKSLIKNYLYILLIFIGMLLISSLIEIFICSKLLTFVV